MNIEQTVKRDIETFYYDSTRVCETHLKRDPSVLRSKGGHKQAGGCSGLQHVLQILQQCRVFIIVLLTDPIRGAG